MGNTFDQLVDKAIALGALEAGVISTEQIVFDSRSYLKCRFGCHRRGRYWACPPHLELPPEKFREAFKEYTSALVIKSTQPKVGQ